MHSFFRLTICLVACSVLPTKLAAQSVDAGTKARIQSSLDELQKGVAQLKQDEKDKSRIADVEIYAKAAEWILRHNEFYKPNYADQTLAALETGRRRAQDLASGKTTWVDHPGTTIYGYVSRIDESVQPYALTLPKDFDRNAREKWPLHVVLHGRGDMLNEVSFIAQHDGKPAPPEQTWVQLDVFGRTNNAYRWAGETDVFEAIDSVKRELRIDERRITLRGFSMGGAGAWHLGLHYPSLWSSVGPGAGFVDFYQYQNHAERLPEWQDKTLRIYDSIGYVQNAYNVPICTYGGALDKQLVASTSMVEAAEKLGTTIQLLIGKGMGHKFHPDSFREFMAFHQEQSDKGRPDRNVIHFTTFTPKYNQCESLAIEELEHIYERAEVESSVGKKGELILNTSNVAVLSVLHSVAEGINIDGNVFSSIPVSIESGSREGELPRALFAKRPQGWELAGDARRNVENGLFKMAAIAKWHNRQGPIDDAFTESFVCVRGTGKAWSPKQAEWGNWTLERFKREFDKWFRGRVRVVDDKDFDIRNEFRRNLILFGDPGSNNMLAEIVGKLPIQWTRDSIVVNGQKYDPNTHGLSLIYPNPLNSAGYYVVINSGHTFHEKDFRSSNAWLFPRLGDIAVQKFEKQPDGRFQETTVWADLFDSHWQLRKSK